MFQEKIEGKKNCFFYKILNIIYIYGLKKQQIKVRIESHFKFLLQKKNLIRPIFDTFSQFSLFPPLNQALRTYIFFAARQKKRTNKQTILRKKLDHLFLPQTKLFSMHESFFLRLYLFTPISCKQKTCSYA